MIPYGDFYFFYILALALLPAIFLGLLGKPIRHYGFFLTVLMTIYIFKSSQLELKSLACFYIIELIIIKAYLIIQKKYNKPWLLWIFLLISIMPLTYSLQVQQVYYT